MKSIPIKFRGKEAIKGGNYIYGDFVTREGGAAIRVRQNRTLFNLHEYEIAVVPETVSQLVGYDANGNEVYEGDIVKAIRYPFAPSLTCTYYGIVTLINQINDPYFKLEDEGYNTCQSYLEDMEYTWQLVMKGAEHD